MSSDPCPRPARPAPLHLVPDRVLDAPVGSATTTVGSDRLLRAWVGAESRLLATRQRFDDRGQSTAEYALVLLGAATVALMLVAWASRTDKIGALLDGVLDSILSRLS